MCKMVIEHMCGAISFTKDRRIKNIKLNLLLEMIFGDYFNIKRGGNKKGCQKDIEIRNEDNKLVFMSREENNFNFLDNFKISTVYIKFKENNKSVEKKINTVFPLTIIPFLVFKYWDKEMLEITFRNYYFRSMYFKRTN